MSQPHPARRHHLAKDSAPERSARRSFIQTFVDVLQEWHGSVLEALVSGDLLLAADEAARRTVRRTLRGHRDPITVTVETLYEDAAAAGRGVLARRFDLDIGEDVSDRVARELQAYAGNAATITSERMADDIAEALREAYQDGVGIPEMERILREEVFPEMRPHTAERVARTEGTAAAARGATSAIRDAGAPGKEWLSEDDHRTRGSHRAIDGQVVPVGGKFTTGRGNRAWWPGDPRLPIGDRANCRCSVAPVWDL